MKKILITGGPVHAYLDAVKIITNRFKGGLMANLADNLTKKFNVTYLTSKGSVLPYLDVPNLTLLYHDGFTDYQKQVLELAPQHDAVILGAAVANLIPLNPLKGKFPSHNYKVGDIIPINFTIAPRIINMVKSVAPQTHLFGFKLLSNVPHQELVSAAYEVLLDSHATAVFANDATSLMQKFAITKERGVHPMDNEGISQFVWECINDEYYKSNSRYISFDTDWEVSEFNYYKKVWEGWYPPTPEGYTFGTIAIRGIRTSSGFLTTGRGKKELDDLVYVYDVDHVNRVVYPIGKKASLNAPLMDWIFKRNPNVSSIVHMHNEPTSLQTLPYAPPGTVRDTQRNVTKSFNIKGHGCFWLYNSKREVIV
jgi:phosphopantothenate---cysteine ligase (CTP)